LLGVWIGKMKWKKGGKKAFRKMLQVFRRPVANNNKKGGRRKEGGEKVKKILVGEMGGG